MTFGQKYGNYRRIMTYLVTNRWFGRRNKWRKRSHTSPHIWVMYPSPRFLALVSDSNETFPQISYRLYAWGYKTKFKLNGNPKKGYMKSYLSELRTKY